MSFYQDFVWGKGITEEHDGPVKTAKKSSMKFDPTYTQDQMAQYVLLRSDHIPLSGYAVGNPADLVWKYVPNMPLKYTDGIKGDWAAWFKGEEDEWVYNHGRNDADNGDRDGHFDKWVKNPSEKPVILMEGTDGKLHIWDGHHRVGVAHVHKMETIPALIGRRKSSIANGKSDIEQDMEHDTDSNSSNFKDDT